MRRILLIALALLALAACTGVPDSSAPQTVQPVQLKQNGTSPAGPVPGAIPFKIVSDFLSANGGDPSEVSAARAFLTQSQRSQWSDQKVTIVSNEQIRLTARPGVINVYGQVVGTIDPAGIYTPSLQGTGNGNGKQTAPFPFTLVRVNGQWRIDSLRSGLLITTDQFRSRYQQHPLYFYDLSQRHLLPDVRWTAIPTTETTQLASWLVDQLVAGPRPELADGVSATFPTQADSDRILVRSTSDSALSIEIAGSSRLPAGTRNLLAQQLARTLVELGVSLTITDDAAPVTIPQLNATSFDLGQLDPSALDAAPEPALYYLDNGRVTTSAGKHVAGPLGNGQNYLNSLALAQRGAGNDLVVAGAEEANPYASLWVGTQSGGLRQTVVHGLLTRPSFAPGGTEVWIGDGATLHRVVVNGLTAKDSTVQLPPAAAVGRILSVQVSPDGSHLALVIAAPGASAGSLYVGAIIRDVGGTVGIGTLVRLSPSGVQITDAAWSTAARLVTIGYYTASTEGTVSETGVDGSFWSNRGLGKLPAQPQTITATGNGAWVDTGGQVWYQTGSTWSTTSETGSTTGYAPTYVVQ